MRITVLAGVLFASVALSGATLEQAIREALAHNAGLQAERANIAVAGARVLGAGLRPNPTLSFSGDHLDVLGSRFSDLNGGGPSEIVAGIEFTHERGGKRERRIEVALAARSVSESGFDNASRELVLDVENAFVDALLARDTLQLARENLGFFNQIVELNEARVRAGDLPEVELIRSRVAALQYQTAVRQSELKLTSALARVQTLMGRRPARGFEITGDLDRKDALPLLPELLEAAFASRPDLKTLRLDAQRAAAELRLQEAQAKPDITIGTEYRRQQVNARANALTVTLGVPLPVFNRNQGEVARAVEERRQAELRIRALESAIAGEVETAYAQFTTARELLGAIRGSMIKQARDVREITEFSYKRGDASLLALLDAQRAFNDAMQAHIEARAEYARSLYLLDFVSGKGAIQ